MEETNVQLAQNVRDVNIITNEIKNLIQQAQSLILNYAIEIGRRLYEAKELLPYGKWGEWLKEEVKAIPHKATNQIGNIV